MRINDDVLVGVARDIPPQGKESTIREIRLYSNSW